MKRSIYILLCLVSVGLLGYTGYYITTHKSAPPATVADTPAPVATTTPVVVDDKNTFSSKSGKKIKVLETNPTGESLSTITITPSGFATNSPIILETNKLTNTSFSDINSDTFEELVITTMSQGSGSFGEVFIYTSASNTQLLPVTIPEMTEDDTKKGALLEGYMGHDTFTISNGLLIRTFPTYRKTDTNNEPTGPIKTILYQIQEKKGSYVANLLATTTLQLSTSSQQTKASTTTQ